MTMFVLPVIGGNKHEHLVIEFEMCLIICMYKLVCIQVLQRPL